MWPGTINVLECVWVVSTSGMMQSERYFHRNNAVHNTNTWRSAPELSRRIMLDSVNETEL